VENHQVTLFAFSVDAAQSKVAPFRTHLFAVLRKKSMRKVLVVLCAGVLFAMVSVRALAQDVNAPIRQLLDGFNSGDMKAVSASYATGDISIVDEVAPFHWNGPHAGDAWGSDLEKHDKAAGIADAKVKDSAPVRSEVEGDAAYVVVPVQYVFKEKGKAMLEDAQMTFVLHREAGAWKVAGWVWSGKKPYPAK
jgi:ketosteroid isomerase-like protein